MSAGGSSRLSHWWLQGGSAFGRTPQLALGASREEWLAAAATRALRWGQGWLQRVQQPDREPQNAEELLEYAFRIERDMPGLAADLRAAALRHQGMAASGTCTSQ